MKRPIHFFSGDGSSLFLALRAMRENHPTTWFAKSEQAKAVGKGYVPFANHPPDGALVIFDCTGEGPRGTAYRKAGHLVIGGNPFDRDLELRRSEGARIATRAGMVTPPTRQFKDIPSALRFLKQNEGRWFVKIEGDGVESGTYDAPDAESMSRYLKWFGEQAKSIKPFILQKKVTGIEVSCNGWFNGHEFITPFDITFEEKKQLAGDLGCRTGCESNVVYMAQDDKLADITIALVEDDLAEQGYVGPCDINSIVDEKGVPYFLEFSARLGFDATQAYCRLFPEGEMFEQWEAFAAGELDAWEPITPATLSSTLRLTISPYPVWDDRVVKKVRGMPLDYGIMYDPMIDPVDVTYGPAAAGAGGVICTVGALGLSIQAMRKELLARAEMLEIPDKQYRIDPLARVTRDMQALDSLGLLGFKDWKA